MLAFEAFLTGRDDAEPKALQMHQHLIAHQSEQVNDNGDLYAHLTKQQKAPTQGKPEAKKLLPGNINRLLTKPGGKDPHE